MSRVLSRRRPGRFLLRLRFGFVGGCGPSLGNERDAAAAPRRLELPATRKKSLVRFLDPSATCQKSQKAAPRGASIV